MKKITEKQVLKNTKEYTDLPNILKKEQILNDLIAKYKFTAKVKNQVDFRLEPVLPDSKTMQDYILKEPSIYDYLIEDVYMCADNEISKTNIELALIPNEISKANKEYYLEMTELSIFLDKNKDILLSNTKDISRARAHLKDTKLIDKFRQITNTYLYSYNDYELAHNIEIYFNFTNKIDSKEYWNEWFEVFKNIKKNKNGFKQTEIEKIHDFLKKVIAFDKKYKNSKSISLGRDGYLYRNMCYNIGFFDNNKLKGKNITNELAFVFDYIYYIKQNRQDNDGMNKQEKYTKMKDCINAYEKLWAKFNT